MTLLLIPSLTLSEIRNCITLSPFAIDSLNPSNRHGHCITQDSFLGKVCSSSGLPLPSCFRLLCPFVRLSKLQNGIVCTTQIPMHSAYTGVRAPQIN